MFSRTSLLGDGGVGGGVILVVRSGRVPRWYKYACWCCSWVDHVLLIAVSMYIISETRSYLGRHGLFSHHSTPIDAPGSWR